jgi:Zn-dependent protease
MTLTFRLGKIPVNVRPTFFILAAILGLSGSDMRVLLAWVATVFVSVMLHELGHAMMGIAFGLEPRIDLHGMGGTTSWSTPKQLSTAQRIAISLAGPFAGFAVGGLVFALVLARVFPVTDFWNTAVQQILFVNVGWGVFNLLPILPLDGGNVLLQVINALKAGRGERAARIVSMIAAALLALFVVVGKLGLWGAMLTLSFIAINYQGLMALGAREHDAPMRTALQQAYAALDAKDAERVLALARPVALSSKTPQVRAEALQLVAFGFLLEGRVADADAAIAALPRGYAPHPQLVELRAGVAARG